MKSGKPSDFWSHKRFKIIFRNGAEGRPLLRDVIDEPIDSGSLIDELVKPPSTPPLELYSNSSFLELLSNEQNQPFSKSDVVNLLAHFKWEHPLKNTEHIIQLPFMDLVDTSGWGVGKTTRVL